MAKRFFLGFLLALAFTAMASAQDQDLNKTAGCQGSYYCGGPNSPLQGIPWGAFTQNYLLTPRNPDQGVCIYVVNNNPTNAHPFTLAVSQTGDPNIISFSGQPGRWTSLGLVSTSTGSPSVPANSTVSFFTRSNAAAKIAFQFGGAGTLAGSPDTADVFITQTSGSGCGAVNPATGQAYGLSTPASGGASTNDLQVISDGISQSFYASLAVTNPAINAIVYNMNANSGARTLYMDKMILSCSAACTVNIVPTTSTGSGCLVASAANQKPSSAINSTSVENSGCTTPPSTAVTFLTLPLAAGTGTVIDLRGFIFTAGSTTGMEANMAVALTGTINVTMLWYEK